MAESETCGGTGNVLPEERKKATFDVEKLTNFLDGGKKNTIKRRWIISPTEDNDKRLAEKYFWSRDEAIKQHLKDFISSHEKFWAKYVPTRQEIGWMSENSTNGGALMNHYGLFLPTILGQANSKQQMEWLPRCLQMKMIGCYAQTEMGHGSNVRGLRTIATYDKQAQNFILSTPTLQSIKWWPGALGKVSTHAAVYAQLIIDDKPYGVHCFMVQIRDENHHVLPGLEIGDIGPKCGDHANDTGYMKFNNVRVPRENLFAKYQHVTPEGKYVKSESKTSDKAHYATMVSARGSMTKTAGGKLAIAVTIATRYSCIRKQGFEESKTNDYLAPERVILDHQVQRYRVLKQLALTYAMKFTGNWMINRFSGVDTSMRGGKEVDNTGLQEVFATSSGLKGLCTYLTVEGIEDLRKCCGGNGYLLSSGIGALEGDYKWQTTAEGDFVILMLQTARYLIKSLNSARKGEPLSGLCTYLTPLRDPHFNLASMAVVPSTYQDFMNIDFLLKTWCYRTLLAVVGAGDALQAQLDNNVSFDEAWNRCALQMFEAVKIHCLYSMLTYFANELATVEDPAIKLALSHLCMLFGASQLVDASGGGLFSFAQLQYLRIAVEKLMDLIRPNAVALVDAFDIPDRVLNSTIGRFDGNVYEALYESAKLNPLNKQEPFEGYSEVLRPYLDLEYLKKGRQAMEAEAAKVAQSKL
eukprot:c12163_g1_i1.p1 GENE.c12163_g1_i1~~c12163_g1_i1.p1  ORF type:complete len:696 (-),score=300.82 c12163_g1_i1:9-2096(-)